jgi:hypothetical protein
MVKEAEEFADQDKAVKSKIDARNSLETFLYNAKSTVEDKAKDKVGGRAAAGPLLLVSGSSAFSVSHNRRNQPKTQPTPNPTDQPPPPDLRGRQEEGHGRRQGGAGVGRGEPRRRGRRVQGPPQGRGGRCVAHLRQGGFGGGAFG